jgi:hypothetical protein
MFSRPFLAIMALVAAPAASEARVKITVDLSSQTMNVDSSGGSYSWPISSAREGYVTPRGAYGVQSLQPMHYSKKYHNSPMPHSIFFNGGYAIHGTYDLGNLGRPASHGCVRISPTHAATLFALVREEGATINIVGSAPSNATPRPVVAEAAPQPVGRAEQMPRRARDARVVQQTQQDPIARIFGAIFTR